MNNYDKLIVDLQLIADDSEFHYITETINRAIHAINTLKRMDKKLKTETDELSPEAWLERLIGIMDGEELNEH